MFPTVKLNCVLRINANDYRQIPNYRDLVEEFIKENMLKVIVGVSVDGRAPKQATTIADVDGFVEEIECKQK